MKRKIGEVFTDYNGLEIEVAETKNEYPECCLDCCYYSNKSDCFGALDETGDCLPSSEGSQRIFKCHG